MNPESILNRPLARHGKHLFLPAVETASLKNWDALASRNPIHAAISQDDERGEIKKGAHEYETILREARGGVLLDLGCGYGRVAKHVLPRRTYQGYVGVDNSLTMLKAFEERYRSRAEELATPLMLVKGAIDDLPLRDGSIDAVITSAVWLHNPKSVAARSVREVFRVLKPGGKLLVFSSFPNGGNPANWQEKFYTEAVLPLLGKTEKNGPVRVYSEGEVRSMLSPFSETRIVPFGCRLLTTQLLVLPRMVNWYTWKQLALPANRAFCKLLGPRAGRFCVYFDAIAVK